MIENQMVVGNVHDSSNRDYEHVCSVCEGELYFGTKYYEVEYYGVEYRFCESCIVKQTAGE